VAVGRGRRPYSISPLRDTQVEAARAEGRQVQVEAARVAIVELREVGLPGVADTVEALKMDAAAAMKMLAKAAVRWQAEAAQAEKAGITVDGVGARAGRARARCRPPNTRLNRTAALGDRCLTDVNSSERWAGSPSKTSSAKELYVFIIVQDYAITLPRAFYTLPLALARSLQLP
jgi:hypothetical protein